MRLANYEFLGKKVADKGTVVSQSRRGLRAPHSSPARYSRPCPQARARTFIDMPRSTGFSTEAPTRDWPVAPRHRLAEGTHPQPTDCHHARGTSTPREHQPGAATRCRARGLDRTEHVDRRRARSKEADRRRRTCCPAESAARPLHVAGSVQRAAL
jgi:hypothetical protein